MLNYCATQPTDFSPGGNASGNTAQIQSQNQLITAGQFQTYCASLGL